MLDPSAKNARAILLAIVLGLAAWGIFHTIGAYRSVKPVEFDIRRSLIVAASFLAFLGFWGLMLYVRQSRLRRRPPRHPEDADGQRS